MTKNEKPRMMDPDPGEDESYDVPPERDLQSTTSAKQASSSAPSLITDGVCNACELTVDVDLYSIKCFFCKNLFHAVDCCDPSYCVSAKTPFIQHLKPALENLKSYETRFGKFFFACNSCCTNLELKIAINQDKRVDLLDKKMDNVRQEFREELSDLKRMISSITVRSPQNSGDAQNDVSGSIVTGTSAWSDPGMTRSLFNEKVLIIKKANGTSPLDPNVLRKTCVENGIQVKKTFSTAKHETGIVLNCDKAAATLVEKLKTTAPEHHVSSLTSKTPTIHIVGVPPQISKEDLQEEIFLQNPIIKDLHTNPKDNDDGKFLILSITKVKTNDNIGKATVGVSNLIRDYIDKSNDRIYLGNGTCKIYDTFHVKRCYNCQKYGHVSEKCTSSTPTCGFCAESHETRNCPTKDSSSATNQCCTNCKNSSDSVFKENCQHPVYSVECPVLKAEQSKLKKTIPFYQRKLSETQRRTQ